MLTIIVVSLYYFPIIFTAFPIANTKLILASLGLVLMGIEMSKKRSGIINKDLVLLSVFASIFSLACFFSVTWNSTTDYAYATYIISMWVWISGAYVVVWCIKVMHGCVTFNILSQYLTAVCVLQCILAIVIDMNPAFKSVVDAYIFQDQEFLNEVNRLYGIGAMLDTAGIRFSIVLLLLSYLIVERVDNDRNCTMSIYIIAYFIILIIGNMIARTTIIGVILSIFYVICKQMYSKKHSFSIKEIIIFTSVVFLIFIPVVVYFYNTNPIIHRNLRFGFEGFFSLIEDGKWEVGSNETLKSMITYPESLKTWIIGDGYFSNPVATDPYFTGKIIGGYYMGTDIGYLRFIFYSGIIGLLLFAAFICKAGIICMHYFLNKKLLFYLFIVTNFIVWFKVSTDIFLVFALFLMVGIKNEESKLLEQ